MKKHTKQTPVRADRRGHETPLPRMVIPQLSPRATAARARALAQLSQGGLSPFRDYRDAKNRVFWNG